MPTVYRIQDVDGRGPWRQDFSHVWTDNQRHENLPTPDTDFGNANLRAVAHPWEHIACACRTLETLRRWFSPMEYLRLLELGYQAVRVDADRVIADSIFQCVIAQRRPIQSASEPVALYTPEEIEKCLI